MKWARPPFSHKNGGLAYSTVTMKYYRCFIADCGRCIYSVVTICMYYCLVQRKYMINSRCLSLFYHSIATCKSSFTTGELQLGILVLLARSRVIIVGWLTTIQSICKGCPDFHGLSFTVVALVFYQLMCCCHFLSDCSQCCHDRLQYTSCWPSLSLSSRCS